jgi:hypothetical protein
VRYSAGGQAMGCSAVGGSSSSAYQPLDTLASKKPAQGVSASQSAQASAIEQLASAISAENDGDDGAIDVSA